MSSTVTFDETASIPLSADQWQGLARLGELVTVVDRALDGPMGAVSVGYLASLMTLAPSNTLSAVREVLEMLTEWHEHGVLTQIRALVDMMGSVLSSENINTVAMATVMKLPIMSYAKTKLMIALPVAGACTVLYAVAGLTVA